MDSAAPSPPSEGGPSTTWSEYYSQVWEDMTSSRDLGAQFWIAQIFTLALLFVGTYFFGNAWDKYADKPVGRLIDRYLDAAEVVARPISRVTSRWIHKARDLALRWLPSRYTATEHGHWLLLAHAGVAGLVGVLALQHWGMSAYAVATKGAHRSEVPMLAAGVLRHHWQCPWLRIQDGVLPQRLAALPLSAQSYWWPVRPMLASQRVSDEWGDASFPYGVNALLDTTHVDECAVHGDFVWRVGRALLRTPHNASQQLDVHASDFERLPSEPSRSGSPPPAAPSPSDALLADARSLHAMLIGLPLHLLTSAASGAMWGPAGALLTAALCAFCPAMLGHGSLVTADASAALFFHATLLALWQALHATSMATVLFWSSATAALFGVLVCCGPMALLIVPSAFIVSAARAVAAIAHATRGPRVGRIARRNSGEARLTLRADDHPAGRPCRMACASVAFLTLLTPMLGGAVAASIHTAPLWASDDATRRAEADAWAAATKRLSLSIQAPPPAVGAGVTTTHGRTRKKRRHGSRNLTRRDRALSRMATGMIGACEVAAESLRVPRILLTPLLHHAATVADLVREGRHHREWGAPAAVNTSSSAQTIYLSGTFALQHEAVRRASLPPFATYYLYALLLKTPPTAFYLLALLALVALRTPLLLVLRGAGVPLALALFAQALRLDVFANWARRRIAAMAERSEWQKRVDAAFDQLLVRWAPRKRDGADSAPPAIKEAATVKAGVGELPEPRGDGSGAAAGASTALSEEQQKRVEDGEEEGEEGAVGEDGEQGAGDTKGMPPLRQWLVDAAWHLYISAPAWSVLASLATALLLLPPPPVGHRFLLAVYPAAYMLLGGLGSAASKATDSPVGQPLLTALIVLLVSLFVLDSAATNPHYIAYAAPVAGGRAGASFHLLGDNNDLGQDLPALATWLHDAALPGEPAYLAYCGEDSPSARGIHARRLPAFQLPAAAAGTGCAAAMSEAFDFVPPRLREEAGAEAADDAPEEQRALTAAERYAALAASAARAAHAQARALAAVEDAVEDALEGIGHEVARESALEEAHAALVPGLYLIESNVLHGASSPIRGPWTDLTEGAYQTIRQLGLHRRLAASPLRFGRLCALLRKLPPTGNVGGTIWAYRLGGGEIERATEEAAAEVFPSSALSPGMRREQQRAVEGVLRLLGVELELEYQRDEAAAAAELEDGGERRAPTPRGLPAHGHDEREDWP